MITDHKWPTCPTQAFRHTNTQPDTEDLTPTCAHTARHVHTHVYTYRYAHLGTKNLTLIWQKNLSTCNVIPVRTTSGYKPHKCSKTPDSSCQRAYSGHLQKHGSAVLPYNAWASGIGEASKKRANRELHSLPNRAAQLDGGLEHHLKGTLNILGATHDAGHILTQIVLLHVVENRIGKPLWGGKLDPGSKLTASIKQSQVPRSSVVSHVDHSSWALLRGCLPHQPQPTIPHALSISSKESVSAISQVPCYPAHGTPWLCWPISRALWYSQSTPPQRQTGLQLSATVYSTCKRKSRPQVTPTAVLFASV